MTQARSTFEEKLDSELLDLVSWVSSIRAGKTFTPTDYTNPTKQAVIDLIKSDVIEKAGVHLGDYTEQLDLILYILKEVKDDQIAIVDGRDNT